MIGLVRAGAAGTDVNGVNDARCELDSRADTCVAGPNFIIDDYTGKHCDVAPYSEENKPITDVPFVNA